MRRFPGGQQHQVSTCLPCLCLIVTVAAGPVIGSGGMLRPYVRGRLLLIDGIPSASAGAVWVFLLFGLDPMDPGLLSVGSMISAVSTTTIIIIIIIIITECQVPTAPRARWEGTKRSEVLSTMGGKTAGTPPIWCPPTTAVASSLAIRHHHSHSAAAPARE